ncbi:XRE family transcriptional regulator [Enterococcus cecorum]|uniref:helix-turn-helix domain-containing protein n=1 Tax=Enterococcus cecorum TaxID=44008 RepID=UPI0032C415BC
MDELARYAGEKIKYLRVSHGMTQEDLANKLNIGKSAVSNYEKGYRKPKQALIFKLANLFDVSINYFFPETTETINNEILIIYNQLNDKRKEITLNFTKEQLKQQQEEANIVQGDFSINEDSNIYKLEQHKIKHEWRGPVSAGTGEFLFEEQSEYVEIDENEVPDRSDFCLTVNGNSMEPIFKDGSYIFVEEKEEIPSGTIGVVIVDGEAFVKRVWFEGTQARLESFNKAYKDIIVTRNDSFKIIGKVVM